MKHIIRFSFLLLVFMFIANASFAQHWADSTVAVPESVFPIGGINFGLGEFADSVNSLKDAGFNMLYERATQNYAVRENIKAMTHGLVGYMSMDTLTQLIGYGAYGAAYFPGSERRFFLASNDVGVYAGHELDNNWEHKVGLKNANNEWFIPRDSVIFGNTDYILTDLQVDANSLQGGLGNYIVWPQTDSAFCDFIFRIDTLGISSTTWDSARYCVEYYLKDANDSVIIFFDTITINKQLAFLQAGNRDTIEHRHIVKFPNPQANPSLPLTEKYYARIRHVLPIHISGYQAKTLEVKLRTFHTQSQIFVRGLRIRSRLGEQILSGQRDNALDSLFETIKDTLIANGILSTTRALTAGGEPQSPVFRVLSYIDDRCNKKIQKRLFVFLTEDGGYLKYPWFRSIYEDQTDSIPPPLQAECIATFYAHHGETPPIPRDCIPDSIFNLPHFTSLGQNILPVHDTSYTFYTKVIQDRLGWCSKYTAAQTAYPPGKRPGKWYGMLSGLFSIGTESPDSGIAGRRLRDSLIARMKRGICNPKSGLFRMDELFDSSQVTLDYRMPFRSEMRAEGWDAIAWGAKGIYWNALGRDGGQNNGITDVGLKRDKDYDSTALMTGGWLHIPDSLYTGFMIFDSVLNHQICIATADTGNMIHRSKIVVGSTWVRAFIEALDSCYVWDPCSLNSLCNSWFIGVWAQTFYGYRERWNAVKRFSQDIIPIAPTLSTLDWKDAFVYDKRFPGGFTHNSSTREMDSLHAVSAWAKFPLKDVRTRKIQPRGASLIPLNQFDSANTTLVELGLFSSKEDTSVRYIVVANHRTWPVYYNANGSIDSSQGRLGAIDAREVQLKFDYKKFHDTNSIVLSITNMRTGKDTIIHRDSIYSLIFEPGEGTLLKVGPAPALILGEMDNNLGSRQVKGFIFE